MSNVLHVVFHNVNHSPQHTHAILEQCAAWGVDVVCLQEPWYGPIRPIPSASPAGPAERTPDNTLYGTQLHPAWLLVEARKDARVVCHVSRRLANAVVSLDPSVNHRDCILLSIRPQPDHDPVFILNVYNDAENAAVEYLSDIAPSLPALDIAGGDYNTHSRVWDPDHRPDSAARSGGLLDLHAQLGLRLLSPPGIPTHFPHNARLHATVIDLVWVPSDRSPELYDIRVAPEERGTSDHAVIHARIPTGAWSYAGAPSIAPKSEEEKAFIKAILDSVHLTLPVDTPLNTAEELCSAVDSLFSCILDAWAANASPTIICNKSRLWWDQSCTKSRRALEAAQSRLELIRARGAPAGLERAEARAAVIRARKRHISTIRLRRKKHMDEQIEHIATSRRRVWDLMSWVGPRAMPMYRSLVHNGAALRSLPELWQALDETFHTAASRPVDPTILDEIPGLPDRECPPISITEVTDAIRHVSPSSAPGWDNLHWRHLKLLLRDDHFLQLLTRIFNAILCLGVWPAQFKRAVSVVIPKPYKDDYSRVKSYRPIVLLSTLGKLFEKVLSERLHYECLKYNILHPDQFGGTKAHSTVDAASSLVTHIRAGWRKGLVSSCLAFDVSQFFPSMNHALLCRILRHFGFASTLVRFFQDYLSDRRSCFRWGRATSPWFDLPEVGAGQGSALSPILTNIYIAPAVRILSPPSDAPDLAALKMYVDDGMWLVTSPTIEQNCDVLCERYAETVVTFGRIGLFIDDDKKDAMHFISGRLARTHSPLPLRLTPTLTLQPATVLRWLGFRLDPRLSFRAHVAYFAERAASTVSAMLMLGSSLRGLTSLQRRTLYISCVRPLLTYGAEVWYRPTGCKTLMQPLVAAQNRALRWITGAFRTTPTGAMHSFAGVMPLHLHCRKLQERYFLRLHTLPATHPLRALFPTIFPPPPDAPRARFPILDFPRKPPQDIPLAHAFPRARPLITETFDPSDDECQPGLRVRDLFADRITTHLSHPPKKDQDALSAWIESDLRPRIAAAHQDPTALVLFTDGSSFVTAPDGMNLGSAAGYRAYHAGRLLRSRSIYTGYAFSFDCELIALSMAVAFGYLKSRYTNLHIFSDSENSLSNLTDVSGGRMGNVNACRILRDWFERNPDNHLHLHYCPSHSGIEENDAIDADVKHTARYTSWRQLPRFGRTFPTSHAFVKHSITDYVAELWRQEADANPRAYWGRYHLSHPAFRRFQHTGTSFPLKRLGGRPPLVSRFIRCISGHAPTGHYRDRFRYRHGEPTMCVLHSGDWAYHTREHVLFKCDHYTRRYRHSSIEDLLASLDPFYDIHHFLLDNPTAFSFEDAPSFD